MRMSGPDATSVTGSIGASSLDASPASAPSPSVQPSALSQVKSPPTAGAGAASPAAATAPADSQQGKCADSGQ